MKLLKTILYYTILTVFLAILFNILSYFPNKKETELFKILNNMSKRVESIDNKLNSIINE